MACGQGRGTREGVWRAYSSQPRRLRRSETIRERRASLTACARKAACSQPHEGPLRVESSGSGEGGSRQVRPSSLKEHRKAPPPDRLIACAVPIATILTVHKSPSLPVAESWLSTVVFAGRPTVPEPSVFINTLRTQRRLTQCGPARRVHDHRAPAPPPVLHSQPPPLYRTSKGGPRMPGKPTEIVIYHNPGYSTSRKVLGILREAVSSPAS